MPGRVLGEHAQDAVVAGQHLPPQALLHQPGGHLHQRKVARVGRPVAAGHVDHAEDLAALGIVDWCGGALPAVHLGAVMLGREDLHGVVGGQRGADGVRARRRFAPGVAGAKANRL
jgi:hypothetical protein